MCGLTRRADLIQAETRDEEHVLTCVLGKNFDYQLPGGGSSKVQGTIACKADEVAVRADGSLKSCSVFATVLIDEKRRFCGTAKFNRQGELDSCD